MVAVACQAAEAVVSAALTALRAETDSREPRTIAFSLFIYLVLQKRIHVYKKGSPFFEAEYRQPQNNEAIQKNSLDGEQQ
ncbi:hypothetical protein OUHCRE17_33950 [Enterobacter hormaechei subsp. steigerwaltii]